MPNKKQEEKKLPVIFKHGASCHGFADGQGCTYDWVALSCFESLHDDYEQKTTNFYTASICPWFLTTSIVTYLHMCKCKRTTEPD